MFSGRIKRIHALMPVLIAAVCLVLCGCGSSKPNNKNESDSIMFTVQNTVVEQVKGISITYYIGGESKGTIGAQAADGKLLGDSGLSFYIYRSDLPEKADLSKFSAVFRVTDADGASFDACTIEMPVEFGDEYKLELRHEEGCYTVWQVFDDGVYARIPS